MVIVSYSATHQENLKMLSNLLYLMLLNIQ